MSTVQSEEGESRIIPFVRKLYTMLGNPMYNSIISWSTSGTSFIIQDNIMMATQLLPSFFSHNNFATFSRQLNLYGFRKVSYLQCEYQNEWFQAGKPELLINIRSSKRKKTSSVINKPGGRNQISVPTNYNTGVELPSVMKDDRRIHDMKAELDKLSNALALSKVGILKLKQQRDDVKKQIAFFKEQKENYARKSKRVIMFLVKLLGEGFLQDILQKLGDDENLETGKKRRFSASYITEIVSGDDFGGSNEEGQQTDNMTPSEMQTLVSVDDFAGTNVEKADYALQADVHSSGTIQEGQRDNDNPTASEMQTLVADDPFFWTNEEQQMDTATPSEDAYLVKMHALASKMAMEFYDMIQTYCNIEPPINIDDEEVITSLWA